MSWISEIQRQIKQLVPSTKAYLNKKPGREVEANFTERASDLVFTSDEEIEIKKDFLTLNRYSRPGKLRIAIKGIEIHWVANPKTSAKFNRNYFELRKGGKYGFGSTQFIIDLDGDIIQMIPEAEIAYSSGSSSGYKDGIKTRLGSKTPYYYTLSIECTHTNWKGEMDQSTHNALVELCVHLCKKYKLTARDLYLHYDITGKNCHRWFVDNPELWGEFRDEVDVEL